MNNMDNNWNVSAAVIDAFIDDLYEEYISSWIFISSLTLVFYAALSKFPEEVEHIWFKPFSLPTFLYIFARYAVLMWGGLSFAVSFISLGRSCNMMANAANFMAVLSYIGIQGLLIIRAYSLCKGAKVLTMALAFCFFAQLVVILYTEIAFPGCLTSVSVDRNLILLGQNIVNIITDILIIGICTWKVWGTWKLKRQAGIQSRHSLVSIVFKQGVLRCCFVVIFSITHTILAAIEAHSSMPFLSQDFDNLRSVLSNILVVDFTLDLRRLNSAKISASNISLPTLQFSNVLQHAHQSILVEMATPEEEEEGDPGRDHDDITESVNDMDTQPIQE